jgi:hypothetical protein
MIRLVRAYGVYGSRDTCEEPNRQPLEYFWFGERSVKPGKQIVFRYNNDPSSEEIDLDMDGNKSVPEQGSFIERRGEQWKVVQVNVETSVTEPFEVATHRVFLTNKL